MVCIPCIVIPLLLFVWHRFLQPIFLKFYNPWRKLTGTADAKGDGKDTANGCPVANGTATANGDAKANGGMSCPFSGKKETTVEESSTDKKND